MSRYRSKTTATWLALIGGTLGLHRFYLRGWRDLQAWLYLPATLLGLAGAARLRDIGLDDTTGALLMPLFGLTVTVAMLSAIIYGLTADEKWHAKWNAGLPARASGVLAVLGVILSLIIGTAVLMGTIAFSVQHYFEAQSIQNSARPT